MTRYGGRTIIINNDEIYEKYLKERDLGAISHYTTPEIKYPTANEIASKLNVVSHTWSVGDRYYKIADKYYGDPTLWWLVAWFNQRPLESDVSLGEVISVALPAEEAIFLFRMGGP
tara:strand:- start:4567 stop:4914 length:348 start_codon:yes stop_codon:yes gene_type:complete